jgi:GT2 family glycosyltransferase
MTRLLPISVVVPTKNRPESLARLIESLSRQVACPKEIIVVDDGSSVPAAPKLPASAPEGVELKVIRNERSRGACASRNAGWNQASSEFIAFFDDDAALSGDDGFDVVMRWMQAPECGAVGFRQTDEAGNARGVNPGDSTRAVLAPVFFTYGCVMRRSALAEVGGFPEAFGYYFEENEISLRLLDARYHIVYDPAISVVHYEDAEGRDWRRISRLAMRNSVLTVLANYPVSLVVPGLLRAVVNNARGFNGRVGWDVAGKLRAVGEVAGMSGFIRARRRPVRLESLQKMRNLRRTPVLLDEPAG